MSDNKTRIISAWPIESVTIRVYCKCGGAMHTTMKDVDGINLVLDAFAEDHQGEDHGPCNARTASRARKKYEREPPRLNL